MKKYSIAIIGMGMISKSHAAAIGNLPNALCAAVVDVNKDKAAESGRTLNCPYFCDAGEMLEKMPDIDICIIALPTYLHAQYAALCLEAGKAVLCEKPLSLHFEDALKIKESVKRTKGIFMTAQVVRFWPGYTKIREMQENSELGEIYMAYFSRCSQPQRWDNDWMFNPVKGGGALHDMMVHDVDFMNCLFGNADMVYALGSRDETGCFSNVFASIKYKNGAKSVVETSFSMKSGYPFTMYAKVMGSKATVEYTYRAGFDINQRSEAESCLNLYREGQEPVIEHPGDYDPYTRQLEYFISCVEQRKQPSVVTIDETVEVIRTVDAIEKSAGTGRIVEVASITYTGNI